MFRFAILIGYIISNAVCNIEASTSYSIDTVGCKIPEYPLVSSGIRKLLRPPSSFAPNCSQTAPLLAANNTHIWVVKTSFDIFDIFSEAEFYCCYRNFSSEGNVENIGYGVCRDFNTNIKAHHEMVNVQCYYNGIKMYEDVFRFNFLEPRSVTAREEHAFNIIMLGIDSMSRQNFLRTMPKTSQFLKSRGSIQLYGYNKIEDNSLPNLFPLLTGRSFKEAKHKCWKGYANTLEGAGDACMFMWDVYRSAGYTTALGADSGAGLLGAYEPFLPYKPVDYYLQPFMYEMRHVFKDRTYDYHSCVHNRFVYKELLKYVKDVVTAVGNSKLFGLFWEESVSHGHLNYPHIMDEDYLSVLEYMDNMKYLDDTVIIFFSDHGTRWGETLNTDQGRQESRLPLFEILLPFKFRRQYQSAFNYIKLNSRQLTTPYDIYQTLLDLVNPSALEEQHVKERIKCSQNNINGVSLFVPVSSNRTCKSVGIPEHWCTCITGDMVPVNGKGKIFTAKYLVRHINMLLNEYQQCYRLGIEKILDVLGSKNQRDRRGTYRVMIQTAPGGGVFEGTLIRDGAIWTVSGSVSRLNAYREQSHCINDPLVEMYCACRPGTVSHGDEPRHINVQ